MNSLDDTNMFNYGLPSIHGRALLNCSTQLSRPQMLLAYRRVADSIFVLNYGVSCRPYEQLHLIAHDIGQMAGHYDLAPSVCRFILSPTTRDALGLEYWLCLGSLDCIEDIINFSIFNAISADWKICFISVYLRPCTAPRLVMRITQTQYSICW